MCRHLVRVGKLARLACASTLVLIAVMALLHSPPAQAGGNNPVIHWDSSMIYAGQNNGNPWGPVGENTVVHGRNFSPGQNLKLILAPGDSNASASVCKQAAATVAVATVTTSPSGTFDVNFMWPAAAGHVNQAYSICSVLASNGNLASHLDDGPFTVLSANPPVIDLSVASVAAGGTITVIGHNWVPPQPVSINIAGCAACEPGNTEVTSASTNSTGLNDGSFSIAITIPATTNPGNYVVDALTQHNLEAFYTTGVKHLTITSAAVTPTPSPSLSPSPGSTGTTTPVASPAASSTATANSGTQNVSSDTSGGASNIPLILTLIAIAALLFAAASIILFVLMRRTSPKSAAPGSAVRPGQYAQFGSRGQPIHPAGHAQPGQLPGGMPPQFGASGRMFDPDQPTFMDGMPGGGHGVYAPACSNCGTQLAPNAPACGYCGMPTGMVRR